MRKACFLAVAVTAVLDSMSLIPPPIWSKHPRSDTPLFRFVQNGRAGWIDVRGKVVIPPKFHYISNFNFDDFFEGASTTFAEADGGNLFGLNGNPLPIHSAFGVSRFSEGINCSQRAVSGSKRSRSGPGPF